MASATRPLAPRATRGPLPPRTDGRPLAIRRPRRAMQYLVLALLVLAPYLNLFRMDLSTGSFWLLGQRLWAPQFYLVMFLLALAVFLIIVASLVLGRVFCGWVCPQNLFNELERRWEKRLGRRGTLALSVLIAFLGSFVVLSYLTDGPALLRALLTGRPSPGWLAFWVGATAFFSLALGWWRTAICHSVCPYGFLQSVLTDRHTLRLGTLVPVGGGTDTGLVVSLEPGLATECQTCNACTRVCHMGVDPRTADQRDCVACGECVDACARVTRGFHIQPVLHVVPGSAPDQPLGLSGEAARNVRRLLAPRLAAPIAFGLLALLGLTVGLFSRPVVDLMVTADRTAAATVTTGDTSFNTFVVTITNLGAQEATFRLQVSGLPPEDVRLDQTSLTVPAGQKVQVRLHVASAPVRLEEGVHPFTVVVTGANSQAVASKRATYYVPPGGS